MQEQLFQAMILGLTSFTLLGVVSLKVAVAKLYAKLESQDEYTKTYREHTKNEIKEIRLELKEVWEELRGIA